MPEGTEIGKAYFTVNLDDQTDADYAKLKAKLERNDPLSVKAKVDFVNDPLEETKKQTKDLPPVEVPVRAKNPIDAAWQAQVRASIQSISRDALSIPVNADTAEYRTELVGTIAELQKSLHQEIPAELDDADAFRAQVEALVKTTQEQVKAKIPVKVEPELPPEPVELPVKAENPIDTSWRSQVQASIRAIATDALKIPVTPDTAAFRAQVQATVAELQDRVKQEIPADLADADRFRAQVEGLAKSTQEEVKAKVPVEADTSGASASIFKFTSQSALALAAMFAGMPTLAAAAGAATAVALGGVEGTIIGLGAVALKSNLDVTSAWKTLGTNLKTESASWAQPLAQPFIQSASDIRGTVQALSPQIRTAFTDAAPGVAVLTGAVKDFAVQAMPGVVTATSAAMPVLQGLRTMAGEVGAGFTQFFGNLSTGAHGAQQILGTLGGVIQDFEGFAGQLFANLSNNGNPALQGFRTALQQAEQVLVTLTQNGSGVMGFFQGIGSSLSGALTVFQAAASIISALPTPVTQFAGSLATTTQLARVFGVNIGAVFDGLGGKIKSAVSNANSFGGAMAGIGKAVGPALALSAGLGVLSLGLDLLAQKKQKDAQATAQSVSEQNSFYNALVASNGAIDENIQKLTLQQAGNDQVGKSGESLLSFVAKAAGPNGVALLQKAIEGDQGALKELTDDLNKLAATDPNRIGDLFSGSVGSTAGDAASAVQRLSTAFGNAAVAQRGSAQASAQAAAGFVSSADAMQKALAVANAAGSISDRLTQANQQAAQAADAVANAQHSLAQSGQAVVNAQHGVQQAQIGVANANQAVADAEHGVAQAQRSLAQAYQGVTSAQQAYTRAQQDELQAERDLNKAREQAIQDLKDLHLQLADQVVSEGQARVSLFDAQKKAAALGVDASNAQAVSNETVTSSNEDRVKAALDLLSAQNQLNDAENSGVKLRTQVNEADKAGVEGSSAVVSAKKQLQSAQDQVTSSAQSLAQAQQQVSDAQWGVQQADVALKQAHQGVTDAAWALRQAQLGVTDATWSQHQAAQQLTQAQQQLKQAADQASISFDTNTSAGRQNLGALLSLWDAIQKQGGPVQDQYRALVDQTATSFGISRDRAQEYLEKLGLIPKDFQYSVTAIGQADVSGLKAVWQGAVAGVKAGAGGWNFAEGGYTGDGGKYEPAGIVHKGEWVVPQEQVHAGTMPILQGINAGRVVGGDGASLPGYASGGLVSAAQAQYGMSEMGTAYQSAVNALTVMGAPHPPGLPQYVPPPPPAVGVAGYNASAGVKQWDWAIVQALAMLGLPASFLPAVERRMQQESSGNPTIVNDWDSNWQKGTPSVGLMQVIGPTFRSNAGPFAGTGPFIYGVSVDPVANIYAGLNHAGGTYGPGHGGFAGGVLYGMNKPGGYDSGGYVFPGITPVVNQTGKPEMMLPPKLGDTLEAIHQAVQGGSVGGAAAPVVHVHVNQLAADPYETAQVAARELAWALRH